MARRRSERDAFPTASAPVVGELLDAEEGPRTGSAAGQLEFVRLLSIWTDTVFEIPGLGLRFGLDPIIGLVPIVGDLATSVISLYILNVAQQLQMPRSTLMRMGLNIAIDYVVGSVPFLGNVFDFAWKANDRNLKLLMRSLAADTRRHRTEQTIGDWLFLGGMVAFLAVILFGSFASTIWFVSWLFGFA
jgi:Domain of unknown function (DUF4112)